jgi:DNA (cytosine-5)-methyltransferase 1
MHYAPRRLEKSSPRLVSLFSGCGGFDLGFEKAGFKVLAAFDNDPLAVTTYNLNLREKANLLDLSTLNRIRVDTRPDVVIAGSPCQGFSTLGKRRIDDPRNGLLIHGVRLAISLKPSVIVLENVQGALSGKHRSYWEFAEQSLIKAGYDVCTIKVQATDFGLPQSRRRALLIGSKSSFDSYTAPHYSFTELETCLQNLEGVANHSPKLLNPSSVDYQIAIRIGQNQKLCNVRRSERAIPTWEIPEVFGETTRDERELLHLFQKLRRQIRSRTIGDADPLKIADIALHCRKDPRKLIQKLVHKAYLRKVNSRYDLTNTFNGKYRRLSHNLPSPTVDTRFGQPRYFLHPYEHRGLSVREAARIQGFPDTFKYLGALSGQYRLIGNSVPPIIGEWLARTIREKLL